MADPKLFFCQEGPSARRSKRPHLVEQAAGWRLASGRLASGRLVHLVVSHPSPSSLGASLQQAPAGSSRLQQAANCQAEVPGALLGAAPSLFLTTAFLHCCALLARPMIIESRLVWSGSNLCFEICSDLLRSGFRAQPVHFISANPSAAKPSIRPSVATPQVVNSGRPSRP